MKGTDPSIHQRMELTEAAAHFIHACYHELGLGEQEADRRVKEIEREIERTGTYEHTREELVHGAKMAWRNSNRCIGRLFWDKLRVQDARDATNPDDILARLIAHIDTATNGGKIIPTITVFKAAAPNEAPLMIRNHQLIRYAGYDTPAGIIGDPASIAFTRECLALGWEGNGTDYDLLPLVIQQGEEPPHWCPVPEASVLEVPIEHPDIPAINELGLRWYSTPIIADMMLEIGGIIYTAAPFNGWYMGTEIGARNLADEQRYNKLPAVAQAMGLDTRSEATLWRDRVLVELNYAVLHSFKKAGVSIVDHHTAAHQFHLFEQREAQAGRDVTGDWTWLIPPMSPATTHIFHKKYSNQIKSPNFLYRNKKQ